MQSLEGTVQESTLILGQCFFVKFGAAPVEKEQVFYIAWYVFVPLGRRDACKRLPEDRMHRPHQ